MANDAGEAPPELKATFSATFPDADILGVKLVNGRPTKALIEIDNRESAAIQFAFVAGQLHHTKELPVDAAAHESIVRNITAMQYNVAVEAGEKKQLPYSFALDMQPQDVRLALTAVVLGPKGHIHQVSVHDGRAAIVEAPTSFFDPQM